MKCVSWREVVDSDQEHLLKNVKNLREQILEKNTLIVIIIIIMFLKEVTYAHESCIYLTKNTMRAVMLWNISTILIYFKM